MSVKEKNYAFIDAQNLNLGVQELGWKLSNKRFRRYLTHRYHVTKAYSFIGYMPSNENLYRSLQEAGYILIFKPVLEIKGGPIKGNVDAALVLHTMMQYPNYDKAVIVTGDGDFACLVEYLYGQDKLKRVLSSLHQKVFEAAEETGAGENRLSGELARQARAQIEEGRHPLTDAPVEAYLPVVIPFPVSPKRLGLSMYGRLRVAIGRHPRWFLMLVLCGGRRKKRTGFAMGF